MVEYGAQAIASLSGKHGHILESDDGWRRTGDALRRVLLLHGVDEPEFDMWPIVEDDEEGNPCNALVITARGEESAAVWRERAERAEESLSMMIGLHGEAAAKVRRLEATA